jgi:hypothetical protein
VRVPLVASFWAYVGFRSISERASSTRKCGTLCPTGEVGFLRVILRDEFILVARRSSHPPFAGWLGRRT